MTKKIAALLLGFFCVFALGGCVTDPAATMKAPTAQAGTASGTGEMLAKIKASLPEGTELLKIDGLTDVQNDWLEVDLTGDEEPELICSYLDGDNQVGVVVLQKAESGYKNLFMETFANEDNKLNFDKIVNMKTARLLDNDQMQLVVSYNYYGADYNSLGFQVLGYDTQEKAIKNYFCQTDLPKACLDVQADRLVVEAMGIYKEYKWNGDKFVGQQIYVKPDVNTGDVVIHYAMSKEGPLTVSTTEVTLKVGQRLVLMRDDKMEQQERIMQFGEDEDFIDILDYIGNNVYTAQKPGKLNMTIVPNGGYDWDHAQEIEITVVN
ncbi:MAG: hypothetical protein GX964_01970 [Syntrophomonadaceae bacterium]|jgi:hypothetical protein|nr:hypothetical protein [Syntrophomonadaceae bacterium]